MNDLTTAQSDMVAKLKAAPATYSYYDPVPQGAAKPYITISSVLADPDEELQAATTDASLEFNTWSGTPDRGQSYAMLQFIRARLDGQTIAGAWSCSEEFNEVMEDPASTAASRIYHGVARYRVRV